MKLNMAAVVADAWGLWQRDRDLLIRVAGPFFFLPQYAALLLIAPQPALPDAADQAAMGAYRELVQAWVLRYAPGLIVAALAVLFGTLLLFLLYLDRRRPDLRAGLGFALAGLLPFLGLSLIVSMPVGLSIQLLPFLILIALYLHGRMLLATPMLIAERLGVRVAIRRSFTATRGNSLVLTGVAGIVLFAGSVLALPFTAISQLLGGAPAQNPVALAVLDAGAAAALSIGSIAAVLIQVALYRRMAGRSSGT